jgi:Uma2 family endonuclease
MTTTAHITTAEQLLNASGLGRCELVRGELAMMSPTGGEHAWLLFRLGGPLAAFVEEHKLGYVLGGDAGFHIAHAPDTVRAPDIAFVRAERFPDGPPRGFLEGPPDLAVEIVSPSDRASDVLAKVRDWLEAGSQVVWVVDPGTRSVQVYWIPNRAEILTIDDDLRGAEVVPGFKLPLVDLFAK